MRTEVSTPSSYVEAVALTASAMARGGRVRCGMQCGREATLLMVCEDGTYQGVGCDECWQKHQVMMLMAKLAQQKTHGYVQPMCSRCGDENPTADHIRTEPIK